MEKRYIFDFLNRCFLSLKWLDFFLQGHKTQSVLAYFAEKQKKPKFPIFGREPWTYFFGKMQNFRVFKSMLFSLKWLVFHLQGHKTLSFGQNIQFLTNPFGRIPNVRLF